MQNFYMRNIKIFPKTSKKKFRTIMNREKIQVANEIIKKREQIVMEFLEMRDDNGVPLFKKEWLEHKFLNISK